MHREILGLEGLQCKQSIIRVFLLSVEVRPPSSLLHFLGLRFALLLEPPHAEVLDVPHQEVVLAVEDTFLAASDLPSFNSAGDISHINSLDVLHVAGFDVLAHASGNFLIVGRHIKVFLEVEQKFLVFFVFPGHLRPSDLVFCLVGVLGVRDDLLVVVVGLLDLSWSRNKTPPVLFSLGFPLLADQHLLLEIRQHNISDIVAHGDDFPLQEDSIGAVGSSFIKLILSHLLHLFILEAYQMVDNTDSIGDQIVLLLVGQRSCIYLMLVQPFLKLIHHFLPQVVGFLLLLSRQHHPLIRLLLLRPIVEGQVYQELEDKATVYIWGGFGC